MDEIKEASDCPPIDGGLCVSFHLRGFLHFFEANIPPPQMRAGGRSIENGWGLTGEIGFFFSTSHRSCFNYGRKSCPLPDALIEMRRSE